MTIRLDSLIATSNINQNENITYSDVTREVCFHQKR